MRCLLLLAVLCSGACQSEFALPRVPDNVHREQRGQQAVVRQAFYPDTRQLKLEFQALSLADGRLLRNGWEREYGLDGSLLAERFFRAGEPTGLWRTWHADGAPASETLYRLDGEPGPERRWHANGALASEGLERAGRKTGTWRFYHENGLLAEVGDFDSLGRPSGLWRSWSFEGQALSEGQYAAGRRVGEWILWQPDGTALRRSASGFEF